MPLSTYNATVAASNTAGAIAVTDISIDQKTAAVTFNQPVQFEYLDAPKGVSSHWFFTSDSSTLANKMAVEKAYTTDNVTWYFEAAGYLPYHTGALCLIEDNQVDDDGVIAGLVFQRQAEIRSGDARVEYGQRPVCHCVYGKRRFGGHAHSRHRAHQRRRCDR